MRTVFAVFDRPDEATRALDDFTRAGFSADNVGMLARQPSGDGLMRVDVPGAGPLAANGAMREMLNAGETPDRDIRDTLMRLGVPRRDIDRCAAAIGRGAILEAVVVEDDNEDAARAVFDRYTAVGADRDDIIVPVIREELEIGTREVEAGGVKIASHVRTIPVEQTVTIREERVTVERRVIDRPIEGQDDAFKDRSYDLHARVEEPVVTKRARVVEEIRIHKDRAERSEKISDNLRHTEVQISDVAGERSFDAGRYRDHFERFYRDRYDLNTVAPAYEFGERLANRTGGGDFTVIETDARTIWEKTNPGTWDHFKEAIRAGWQRLKN